MIDSSLLWSYLWCLFSSAHWRSGVQAAEPEDWLELSDNEMNYPQRGAVLRALRGITGKDGGDSPGRWRELLEIAKDEGK